MAKILIVDDSPTEIHVMTQILEGAGHQIISAPNGEDGIEVAKQQLPDLILMDVVMPGLNGFQATRKLSKSPETKDIPVIMVTTKDQDTDKEWAMRQGAKAYLVKPLDKKALLQSVESELS